MRFDGSAKRRWDWTPPRERVLIPASGLVGEHVNISAAPHRSRCGVIENGVWMEVDGLPGGFVMRLEDLEWAVAQIKLWRDNQHADLDR